MARKPAAAASVTASADSLGESKTIRSRLEIAPDERPDEHADEYWQDDHAAISHHPGRLHLI
jgi:hypothetical protein